MKKITLLLALLVVSFGYSQAPTTDPATPPTRNASDVISIFSGAYTDVAGSDYNPNWSQTGHATANTSYDTGSGNIVLAYPNFNYQGVQFGSTQNISGMEKLHVDIWIDGTFNPNIYVISSGAEIAHAITNTGAASWISVDIDVTGITGDLTSAIQFKFDNGNGTTDAIYVDNLYFWKTAAAAGTDATLSDLQVDGATVTGFNTNAEDYSYGLVEGATTIPQITTATTTDNAATAVITQATAIPGDATVVVTAQDGTTTKTYTVSFAITMPSSGATAAPSRNASDVISIFGDSYTNLTGTDFNPGWGQSGQGSANPAYDAGGDIIIAYPNFNYQGMQLSSSQDASSMEYIHFDIWTPADPAATTLQFSPINNGSGAGEVLVTFTYTSGTWTSVDLPIGDFTGMTWDSVHQLKFAGNGAGSTVPADIYIDNLYFYKGTPLSTKNFNFANVSLYPNPTKGQLNISASESIEKASVYNILGKELKNVTINETSGTIDVSNLNSGVYFVKYTINNAVGTAKFIKE